jgi:tetratricopeptide (TPR) repeat protein
MTNPTIQTQLKALAEKREQAQRDEDWYLSISLLTEEIHFAEEHEMGEGLDECYFMLGQAHEALGQGEEAYIAYAKSFSRNPQHSPLLERLAEFSYARGEWENTVRIIDSLLDGPSEPPTTISDIDSRITLRLKRIMAILHLAQIAAALGRMKEMILPQGSPFYASQNAWLEVAELWASIPLELTLLRKLDRESRRSLIDEVRELLVLRPENQDALHILSALEQEDEEEEPASDLNDETIRMELERTAEITTEITEEMRNANLFEGTDSEGKADS